MDTPRKYKVEGATGDVDLMPVLTNADERRQRIHHHVMEGIKKMFPIEGKAYDLSVENLSVKPLIASFEDQKKANLSGSTLREPVHGEVVLRDKSGKEIERKKKLLGHIPFLTERHTFIVKGNEYSVANQLRIKPGIYTRERDNGQLESAFNLSRGKNFRLSLEPTRGIFLIEYGTTTMPLLPLLESLGVTDQQLEQAWGKDLLAANKKVVGPHSKKVVTKLYQKLVPATEQQSGLDIAQMGAQLNQVYDRTRIDPEVTQSTLGSRHDRVDSASILAASAKLLRVFKKEDTPDDRDSLAYKTLHTAETFFEERLAKDTRKQLKLKLSRKLRQGIEDPKIDDVLPPSVISAPLQSFLTTSTLANTPMQINPVELLDSTTVVTTLGEGGISDTLAVPEESRNVHATHLGILDPVRTPESGTAGISVRATVHMARDQHGDMYAPMRNTKSGEVVYVPVKALANKTVAFAAQDLKGKKNVDAIRNGRVVSVSPKEVDYALPHPTSMYGPATITVPFPNSAQGNRIIMGSKQATQALPLVQRDAPYVQSKAHTGNSAEQELAKETLPTSPCDGTVASIDDHYIYVTPSDPASLSNRARLRFDGKNVRVPYARNYPFMSKTHINHEITVKAGDKIKAGEPLADSNFTRNGTMALGKNLAVAYMPYYGNNSNDAVVISAAAAEKLRSMHSTKIILDLDPSIEVDKQKHRVYFGSKYTATQYDKLDASGVIKAGSEVKEGDIIIASIRRKGQTAEQAMLGRLHKSLVRPHLDAAQVWDYEDPGKVVDVVITNKRVTVTVQYSAPMRIGDKLSGRFGNKGVISTIVPDDQMVKDEAGKPVDVIVTSAGVISRINPNQIIEGALGKVVEKTGKPILIEPFADQDNVQFAKDMLKKHGVKDKEEVYDPVSGKKIPGIFVGRTYMYRLFKSTDTNFSARGVGPGYDANMQPSKGGDSGSKAIGKMDFNALLSHNARGILRESATIKSERNDEFWRRVQLGLPLPAPRQTFAYDKFMATLQGAGINVKRDGKALTLAPMTDRDIDQMAQHTIKSPLVVKSKQTTRGQFIEPEKDGLFDPVATGGMAGTHFAKIELPEPVVNPVFEEAARRLLGMSGTAFTQAVERDGAATIKERLNKIEVKSEIERLRKDADKAKGAVLDDLVKRIKYLQALDRQGLRAGDAYVLSKIPVVPPVMRPVMPSAGGSTLVSDANYLYRDLMLATKGLSDTPEILRTPEFMAQQRRHIQDSVSALFGLTDPVSPQNQGRGVKGHLMQITGSGSPKYGFFQAKLQKRQQDLSARATIAPDHTLGIDEVGLPEEQAWGMYRPFIVARLVKAGYPAKTAADMVTNRDAAARAALLRESQDRPVFINRAPTLHRFSLVAAYPRLIPGKTMRLNPFAETGMNADYDGDALQIHLPATPEAVSDAKRMTLSNLVFGDKVRDTLMIFPAHEAIIGLFMATEKGVNNAQPKKFATKAEAMAAYKAGTLKLSDPVIIG